MHNQRFYCRIRQFTSLTPIILYRSRYPVNPLANYFSFLSCATLNSSRSGSQSKLRKKKINKCARLQETRLVSLKFIKELNRKFLFIFNGCSSFTQIHMHGALNFTGRKRNVEDTRKKIHEDCRSFLLTSFPI